MLFVAYKLAIKLDRIAIPTYNSMSRKLYEEV